MDKINITPKRKEIMELMNFNSLFDVLRYYPYRYEILKNEEIDASKDGQKITVEGIITGGIKTEKFSFNRKSRTTFFIKVKQFYLKVILFNSFSWNKVLKDDMNVVITGKLNFLKKEIVASKFHVGSLNNQEQFISIYSLPVAIKDKYYRNFVEYSYNYLHSHRLLKDLIPFEFIERYKLGNLDDALKYIHLPHREEEIRKAQRYLKYEELLNFCVMGGIKRDLFTSSSTNLEKKLDYNLISKAIKDLPFKLSKDQLTAFNEILNDLKSKRVMSRLLQGDVGSGKTVVGLLSLIANYSAHYQGVLMAPTDILAKQHYLDFKKFLTNYPIKVALLVRDIKTKEKQEILKDLKEGNIDIVIGTHALIQDNVVFKNLGLAIVDEQHRFGVKQRLALKEKGEKVDVLYMSATPIPRTLASTIYMDMDVSTISSFFHEGRKVITKYIPENSYKSIKKEMDDYLKDGKKIYVVCAAVNESPMDLKNIEEVYQQIKKDFSNYSISFIHGKLKSTEKEKIMEEFNAGKVSILVSTTVIEVGINIENANMMLILNAERFGLAQLHQLRGRIGRDGNIGYCYLLSDNLNEDVVERLNFLANNDDGFKISEYDLLRRGPGDMLGISQSGNETFKIANLLNDFNILNQASKDAKYILSHRYNYKEYLHQIYLNIEIENKIID